MTKKDFLERNKKELAKLFDKLNSEKDELFNNFLIEKTIEIAAESEYQLELKGLEKELTSEINKMKKDIESFDINNLEKNVGLEFNAINMDDFEYSDNFNIKDLEYIEDNNKQYSKEIDKYPLLTPEEEKKLVIRYNNGDLTARNKLIESNLRLVRTIAKRYTRNDEQLLDLMQEGSIGLQKAIEKFDVNKGYKLSTYAYWWIRQAIRAYIPTAYFHYQIPMRVEDANWQINRAREELVQVLGREATDEEIAKKTGINVKKVRSVTQAMIPAISTNEMINDEDEISYEDLLPSHNQSIENINMHRELRKDLFKAMDAYLTEREKMILIDRYGLNNNGTVVKLGVLCKKYNVTTQRINQIEKKALQKLKDNDRHNQLCDYLEK